MSYWYDASLVKRYKVQNRFKIIGKYAVYSIFIFIALMVGTIGYQAFPAFKKTYIAVDIQLDDKTSPRQAIYGYMYKRFEVKGRKDKKQIKQMFSSVADTTVAQFKSENAGLVGDNVRIWLPASDVLDQYVKDNITRDTPEGRRKFSNQQMEWVEKLKLTEQIDVRFNTDFFINADSRDPAEAGILGAIVGSLLTLGVCLVLTMFIGILGAVYLEEFAKKNRMNFIIESTINNLAAVPSIIFGLLGLAVLLNLFGLPRSGAITGGIVLAMMSLPTIVIATRKALAAIPDSLRDAGLALGCTRFQVVIHHILPQASSRIVTGVIIAMAQAMGETAPLLMIGMVAFVADVPSNFSDASITLPVQVFLWADSAETAFIEKTSAAILVLLLIVGSMIAISAYIRNKFENK